MEEGRETGPGLRYVGDGEWIPGVPARDLTAEEAEAHRERIEACERNTGRTLYVVAGSAVAG